MAFCLTCVMYNARATDTNFRNIRQLVEYLQTDPVLPVLQEPVYLPDIMMEIYQENDFKPLWDKMQYAETVVDELSGVDAYGLLPDDYHVTQLQTILQLNNDRNNPQFDVLLTDGLLLLSHHLLNGKLNPADFAFTWNFPQRKYYEDSIHLFISTIKRERVLDELQEHHPAFEIYKLLVKEREKWVNIRDQFDQLRPLVYSKTIKPGDTAELFCSITDRLKLLNLFPATYAEQCFYDSIYLPYIEKFQLLNGIHNDGVIGKQTVNAINVPAEQRIGMIDANLERIRWLAGGYDDNMVFVNIAGFHLYVIRNKEIIWDTPVMTGAVNTQTPVFTSPLTYIVFNPSWTVPRSILKESMFARMKADPSYIDNNNLYLMDQNGKVVNPQDLDWSTMTLFNFPYTVVQKPGPGNALGQVKFMFPNKYSIYLHDTPSKSLFSQTSRAFSHGCIRVKDPLVLAKILLDDDNKYNDQKIRDIINTGTTKTVFLKDPITVLLTYFTVDIDQQENVIFREDIYHRDPAILEKLKTPLKNDQRQYSSFK